MSATNIVLFAIGIGGISFAFWGLYSQAGQQSFDGMSGMIPVAAGTLGGLVLVLAVLLAGYQFLYPSAPQAATPAPYPDAPRYSEYNHWVLLSVALVTLALFDLFCRLTVGVSGLLIAMSWFEGGRTHWGLSLLFAATFFIHVLMVTDTIGTIHARYFGQPESSVFVGHDLHNGVFRLYPLANGGDTVTTHGGTYEDNDVFADRFDALRWEKTLRFGQRAQDVLGWQSFTTKAAIKAGVLHCMTLAFLGLFFVGLIGWSIDYQGEWNSGSDKSLETGFGWLWQTHRALFLAAALASAGAIVGLAVWAHDPGLVEDLQTGDVFAPLPDTIRPSKVIQGVVVDHAAEQVHFKNQSGPSVSHYNVLVRVDGVFSHSVWLRISLDNIQPVRDWVEGNAFVDGLPQPFVVQDDLSIMPQDLHRTGAGVDGK